MSLVVDSLTKRFDGASTTVLDRVSFTADNGTLTCLLGPSGAGKTTLLHCIAGLLAVDSGTIAIGGQPLDGVPAYRRPLTLLMQQPHLFAHLDVVDNVAFGLRVRNVARRERRRRAAELLAMVGISRLADRSVSRLSGGEQQRVALARALVIEPAVLLADEPFASVDASTRHELQMLLRRLQSELGTTIVMVTHDVDEADRVADCQLVLTEGRVANRG